MAITLTRCDGDVGASTSKVRIDSVDLDALDDAAAESEQAAEDAARAVVDTVRRLHAGVCSLDTGQEVDLAALWHHHDTAMTRWKEAIKQRNTLWATRRTARRAEEMRHG